MARSLQTAGRRSDTCCICAVVLFIFRFFTTRYIPLDPPPYPSKPNPPEFTSASDKARFDSTKYTCLFFHSSFNFVPFKSYIFYICIFIYFITLYPIIYPSIDVFPFAHAKIFILLQLLKSLQNKFSSSNFNQMTYNLIYLAISKNIVGRN